MSRRLASAIVNHPWWVLLAWLVVAVLIVALAPSFSSVRQAGIDLPSSSESVRAGNLERAKFGGETRPTAVVVSEQPAQASALRQWLTQIPDVAQVSPPVPSPDGKAVLLTTVFDHTGPDLDRALAAIEDHLSSQPAGITGSPVVDHDLNSNVFSSTTGSSTFSAARLLSLLVVLVVLALVYRAPLAVLTPLVCIGVVIGLSPRLVAAAAIGLGMPVGSFSLPFMFAVTLGAGTNYGLFLITRYRELLSQGLAPRLALEQALAKVGAAIVSSAITVIAASALMILASFDLFRVLGPPIAISVALMLLAGLTLMPALMSILGRALLWPRVTWSGHTEPRVWRRVGDAVTARPALAAVIALLLLLPGVLYARTVQPSFSVLDVLPPSLPAARGYRLLAEHFPAQLGSLTLLVAPASQAAQVAHAVQGRPHVVSVARPQTAPDGSLARVVVALDQDANGSAAGTTVSDLEVIAQKSAPGATILAAGDPATTRDLERLLYHDFWLIAVLDGIAILILLALLLRSLVAPLYLIFTVALSTATAIGLVALVYQHLLGVALYWAAPVFAFVFLVALGEDFNILLMSRLRQEVQEHGPRQGVARAVSTTGGVITSCGLVMASVFFVGLARSPIYLVQEVGVAVVIGVLLDTLLVRPVLVPCLALLLGSAKRWARHQQA